MTRNKTAPIRYYYDFSGSEEEEDEEEGEFVVTPSSPAQHHHTDAGIVNGVAAGVAIKDHHDKKTADNHDETAPIDTVDNQEKENKKTQGQPHHTNTDTGATTCGTAGVCGTIVDGDHKAGVQEQDESADETHSEADTTKDDLKSDSDDDKSLTDASASDSNLSSTSATSSKRRSRRASKKDQDLAAGSVPSRSEENDQSKTHQAASFPGGCFFIKSELNDCVLEVEGDDTKEDAKIGLDRIRPNDYARQLWSFCDGFLVNYKDDSLVLDGSADMATTAGNRVQLSKKNPDASTTDYQQWGLNMDGSIYMKAKNSLLLTVQENEKMPPLVVLSEQHPNGAKEQRWSTIKAVFKKQKAPTITATIEKTVVHRYVRNPHGWFFIHSFLPGSTLKAPQVLTANLDRQGIHTTTLDRGNWHAQLWTYVGGTIVNYETQLAIVVNGLSAGETVKQANQQNQLQQQLCSLTVDGYLIHMNEPTLALVPKDNTVVLSHIDQVQRQDYRWGFLIPEFTVQHHAHVLVSWKIASLKEWRNIRAGSATSSRVQNVSSAVANWPQETFFITAPNGDALIPSKSEALSGLTVRVLTVEEHSAFRWCFKNGYLVHMTTGLVLHSQDLAKGTRLEVRSQRVGKDGLADERQQWIMKTDGSIVSGTNRRLGLGGRDVIQLVDTKKSDQHISWSVFYGHYKKDVLTQFRRYIFSMTSHRSLSQHEGSRQQLVTKTYGVFPKKWIFIRSKQDASLVLTASNSEKGAKLVLAKLDFKNYKQQLWHTRDDQCLVNFATNYVIDVLGGQLTQGANLIQWNEKFLRRHRINQMWGLSVDGHIHPDSQSGLVIAPKKTAKAQDGVELSIVARGSLDHLEQQWTFATPVFRNRSGAVISIHRAENMSTTDIVVDGVAEAPQTHSDRQTYERTGIKKTVTRRWGLFPEVPFFIRLSVGSDRYALTVESKPIAENVKVHQVTLRPMNFKAHKWQLWIFQDGHLINAETGLALDIQLHSKDISIEEGLHAPACVREVSMDDSQFFALGVHGEIHLQSNTRMVVTVANGRRVSVDGAQIGLKLITVCRVVSENKQIDDLVSEESMRWVFFTPIYRKTTTTTTTSSSVAAGAVAGAIADGELESCEDHKMDVQEQNESASDSDSDSESESESESDTTENDSESDSDDKSLTEASASDSGLSNTSAASSKRREAKKDPFIPAADYVPSGFEKIVRFRTHQASSFPETGYFFIKSDLHGYVLDVEGDGIKEDAKISLTRIRSTDFASQLWTFRDGFLVNSKGDSLVLDGSSDMATTTGNRVHLSKKKPDASTADDQQWAWGLEGSIYLKDHRSLVLSVKELERSDKNTYIDVYVQEEKIHLTSKNPHPEQRWEILIPSMIPVSPEPSSAGAKSVTPPAGHSTSTVVAATATAGAAAAATTAIDALSYKWFHKLHRHTNITSEWADNWFMISHGGNNLFLAAGTEKHHSVGIQELGEHDDYMQFLWTFVDGQLINYLYMLRLVLCQKTQRWILVDTDEEKDQGFALDSAGVITLRILYVVYYLRFVPSSSGAHLLETTQEISQAGQHWQLHTPELSDEHSVIEATQARTKAHAWIREQHTTTTSWTITRASTTTTDTKEQTHASNTASIEQGAATCIVHHQHHHADKITSASDKKANTEVQKRLDDSSDGKNEVDKLDEQEKKTHYFHGHRNHPHHPHLGAIADHVSSAVGALASGFGIKRRHQKTAETTGSHHLTLRSPSSATVATSITPSPGVVPEVPHFEIVLVDIKQAAEDRHIHCERKWLNEDPHYVALSYRWGELDEQIVPATKDHYARIVSFHLDDFFKLCQAMQHEPDLKHIKYVWVDAICVDQENIEKRKATIYNMNSIYIQAAAIVAVPDLHASHISTTTAATKRALMDTIQHYRRYLYYLLLGTPEAQQTLVEMDNAWMDQLGVPTSGPQRRDLLLTATTATATATTTTTRAVPTTELRRSNSQLFTQQLMTLIANPRGSTVDALKVKDPEDEGQDQDQQLSSRMIMLECQRFEWQQQLDQRQTDVLQSVQFLQSIMEDWSNRTWVISECHVAKRKTGKLKFWYNQLSCPEFNGQRFFEFEFKKRYDDHNVRSVNSMRLYSSSSSSQYYILIQSKSLI
ncbi:hypothetical protein BCR42DRAFT_160251 [Absidia repens]|uniref:Ricin B lectin domain-containing protein n=1 Tax=Absidia repens TaxID=90262 RepID=A0A1X2I063_9FUNG|nr:hypothetical protein BCR42DRAFT_160251 [Absidia repens]